jgi:hypothetical protein
MCYRLAAMTTDVGPMIQQWTTGSAISYLRTFVAGVHVELDEVQRYLVTPETAVARVAERAGRLAARRSSGEASSRVAGEEPPTADSGEGEETFLTPRAGSPDSPALMDIDQQFEVSSFLYIC